MRLIDLFTTKEVIITGRGKLRLIQIPETLVGRLEPSDITGRVIRLDQRRFLVEVVECCGHLATSGLLSVRGAFLEED